MISTPTVITGRPRVLCCTQELSLAIIYTIYTTFVSKEGKNNWVPFRETGRQIQIDTPAGMWVMVSASLTTSLLWRNTVIFCVLHVWMLSPVLSSEKQHNIFANCSHKWGIRKEILTAGVVPLDVSHPFKTCPELDAECSRRGGGRHLIISARLCKVNHCGSAPDLPQQCRFTWSHTCLFCKCANQQGNSSLQTGNKHTNWCCFFICLFVCFYPAFMQIDEKRFFTL